MLAFPTGLRGGMDSLKSFVPGGGFLAELGGYCNHELPHATATCAHTSKLITHSQSVFSRVLLGPFVYIVLTTCMRIEDDRKPADHFLALSESTFICKEELRID
ncbi:hypothetical protein IF1G_07067 [Cordyceps javanica]|uniref:Uncharacterized protein n=1 Tax=Cordyceps javanica TaxID=43265 RepID=A0A545UXL7_9HYPO|nr:hypothetical protein IF1G_07067 [Cordyceps javanica]